MGVKGKHKDIIKNIHQMKTLCRDLLAMAGSYPCLECNTKRILSSLEMLELDFPDPLDLGSEEEYLADR